VHRCAEGERLSTLRHTGHRKYFERLGEWANTAAAATFSIPVRVEKGPDDSVAHPSAVSKTNPAAPSSLRTSRLAGPVKRSAKGAHAMGGTGWQPHDTSLFHGSGHCLKLCTSGDIKLTLICPHIGHM